MLVWSHPTSVLILLYCVENDWLVTETGNNEEHVRHRCLFKLDNLSFNPLSRHLSFDSNKLSYTHYPVYTCRLSSPAITSVSSVVVEENTRGQILQWSLYPFGARHESTTVESTQKSFTSYLHFLLVQASFSRSFYLSLVILPDDLVDFKRVNLGLQT